jgi:hypothetical protein
MVYVLLKTMLLVLKVRRHHVLGLTWHILGHGYIIIVVIIIPATFSDEVIRPLVLMRWTPVLISI